MLSKGSQNWKHLKVFPLSPLVLRDVTNIPLLPPLSHPKHFESEGMTSFVLIESGNRTQLFFLVHLLFTHLWPLQSGKLLMKLRIFFSTHPCVKGILDVKTMKYCWLPRYQRLPGTGSSLVCLQGGWGLSR